MSFPPSLMTWQFAAAGLACAALPILIHLFNRRRYRTLHWAAMQLVREAMREQRHVMRIRNLVLLALRALAVILFGLALARPYFTATKEPFRGRAPLHAVLLIDNSLSMSYETLDGTLLERAERRAAEYIGRLPVGSRISIVPLCGSRQPIQSAPYADTSRALDALRSIRAVDRELRVAAAANEARKRCRDVPELAKRIVLFSDQQRRNWRDLGNSEVFRDLPSIQIVDVSTGNWRNASVAELRIQDGLADARTPATIVVVVRYQQGGSIEEKGAIEEKRADEKDGADVQLTLSVADRAIATRTIHFEPGQTSREITFQHRFQNHSPRPDRPTLVPVTASLNADALHGDDHRHLVVPVVASLPVVFVDQYGSENENRLKGRLGETRNLRSLLAPVVDRQRPDEPLLQVRHVAVDQLRQAMLADTRLVVLAGVADPQAVAPMLRDYLLRGGRLLIAAGGDFNPRAWNEFAWRGGNGILPAPLAETLIGGDGAPIESGPIESGPIESGPIGASFFSLDFDSMQKSSEFQLAGNSTQQLRDLYREPVFFRAVRVDDSNSMRDRLLKVERQRIADQEDQLDLPDDPRERERTIARLAQSALPRVLARFSLPGRPPFLLERQIGRGKVLFVATGLTTQWTTLPLTNAFVVFDRLLRRQIGETLPKLEFPTSRRIAVRLPTDDRGMIVRLLRPHAKDAEYVDAGFLDLRQRGVFIERPFERGIYRITMTPDAGSRFSNVTAPAEAMLAVSGVADESDLTPLTRAAFEERVTVGSVRWVAEGETISLVGAGVRGEQLWQWLISVVILLLLCEVVVVVGLSRRSKRAGAGNA